MTAVVIVRAPDWDGAALAQTLRLPIADSVIAVPASCIAYLTSLNHQLQLIPANAQSGPIAVDFIAGAIAHRARGGSELIVKAVKGRSKSPLTVFDATAGLGRDSFVLATHGFNVALFEREPIVAALLADGLQRLRESAGADIAKRMQLQHGDFVAQCANLTAAADVVYLDPMFPHADKSALVKKEMRLFQQLFCADPSDETELLNTALDVARLRVVVKRPRKAEPLAHRAPNYALEGKAVRFDVYLCRASNTPD